MIFLNNGKVQFNDKYERDYNLFALMELGLNNEGYLYDQTSGTVLKYNDKFIKGNVNGITQYAGRNDLLFTPEENFNPMNRLFAYFIAKLESDMQEEGNDFKIIANFIDEIKSPDKSIPNKQRVIVRVSRNGVISDIFTDYFYRTYLAYIHMIFILGNGFDVDLSNFDEPLAKK